MKSGIVFVCISSLYQLVGDHISAPTVEVEICNDAVKCSSVSRDLDFVFVFFIFKTVVCSSRCYQTEQ